MKLFIIILHRKLMDEFSLKTRSDEVLVGLNSSQRLLYVPTDLVTVYILFRTNFKDRDRFCKPSAAPTNGAMNNYSDAFVIRTTTDAQRW